MKNSINYLPSSSNQKYNRINNVILSRAMPFSIESDFLFLNNQFNLSGSKNNALIQKISSNREFYYGNTSSVSTFSYKFDAKGRVIQIDMFIEPYIPAYQTWKLYYKNE